MISIKNTSILIFIGLIMNMNIGYCTYSLDNPEFRKAAYWINKLDQPYSTILSPHEINEFNLAIETKLPNTVYDFHKYPESIIKPVLITYIEEAVIPTDTTYINGAPASAEFYQNLRQKLNIDAINEVNPVKYGFTIKRSNIRTFPTSQGVYASADDQEFDMFQETAVDPIEPVIILHRSTSGDWLYVQTYNYRGWIIAENIAIASNKQEWINYMDEIHFLIVTENKYQLDLPAETGAVNKVAFAMGAKIPLAAAAHDKAKLTVKFPVRDKQGMLAYRYLKIPDSANVNPGYLPYNRANVIKQALKHLGQQYGWGGLHDSVDCSSMIADIYRCFGFKLPRNADQQELSAGVTVSMNNSETDLKLDKLPAGAALYMNGHTMMYLGKVNGKYYIIHSLASYGLKSSLTSNGTLQRVAVMKVVISDLELTRRNGKTFKDSLTSAKILK